MSYVLLADQLERDLVFVIEGDRALERGFRRWTRTPGAATQGLVEYESNPSC